MRVSLFENIFSTKQGQIAHIKLILKGIENGHWEDQISGYRKHVLEHGKDSESKKLKTALPYFTASGIFSERHDSGLVEHSGIVAIDIDNLDDDQLDHFFQDLKQDPYTYSVFRSCSGNGLCILVRIDPADHQKVFRELEQYYIAEYGITIDYLADISRPRFISYDPDLYWNPESDVFHCGTIQIESFTPIPDQEYKRTPISIEGDDLIDKSVQIIERKYQFEEGQRHTYIYNLAKVANKYGISETDLTTFVYGRYDHFRRKPTNAISWVYKHCLSEHGLWQTAPVQGFRHTPAAPDSKIITATRESPIAGSFNTVLNEATGEIKVGETIDQMMADIGCLEIDWSKPVDPPEPIIALDGGTLCTAGNITTVSGYSKAGKSGVLGGLIAGAARVKGDTTVDTLGFDVKLNEAGKALLHIDTEQSRYDFDRNFRKMVFRAGRSKPPEWLRGVWLKGKAPQQMMDYTWALAHHYAETYQGVYGIIVDGIGDYIRQLNDEAEAYELVSEFEKIAETFTCPIIAVLHLNYGSDKQRGHLGSQLRRKSETVMTIKKDEQQPQYSKIEFPLLRNAGMLPNVLFEYDPGKGYHVFTEYDSASHRQEREQESLESMAVGILSLRPNITQDKFVDEIATKKFVTKATANKILKNMAYLGIININPDRSFELRSDLQLVKNTHISNGNGSNGDEMAVPF